MKKIMLDSNIFDDLVKREITTESFGNVQLNVTHIQRDELEKCKDESWKQELISKLNVIDPDLMPTESLVLGYSRVGLAKLGDSGLFEKLRVGKLKNTNDALIAETAMKNDLLLVTNDKRLKKRVKRLGGKCINLDDLLSNDK
nr:type II toxin-antitoxin system VapC family toxin [uncultured Carboxylicivirga sp.]